MVFLSVTVRTCTSPFQTIISIENSGPSTNCSSITLLSRLSAFEISNKRANSSILMSAEILAIPRLPLLRLGFRIQAPVKSVQNAPHATSTSVKHMLFGEGAPYFSNASRIKCLLVALMAVSREIPLNPNSSLMRPITFMLTSEQG